MIINTSFDHLIIGLGVSLNLPFRLACHAGSCPVLCVASPRDLAGDQQCLSLVIRPLEARLHRPVSVRYSIVMNLLLRVCQQHINTEAILPCLA